MTPIISVVIPTYNRNKLLARAVSSVVNQSFSKFEVIVVDDGSEVDPSQLVREIADERFKVIRQKNSGAAAARNLGAQVAKGHYITFLDSDDEAMPDWLDKFADAFQNGADIVCCGLEKIGVGLEVEKRGGTRLPGNLGPLFGDHVGRFSNGGVFALKKDLFSIVGGYDEELRSGQHTELAMRLMPLISDKNLKIVNIYEPLIVVNIHDGPRIRGDDSAVYSGVTRTMNKHSVLFSMNPDYHSTYQGVAGVRAARLGLRKEARMHFLKSAMLAPTKWRGWVRLLGSCFPGVVKTKWG